MNRALLRRLRYHTVVTAAILAMIGGLTARADDRDSGDSFDKNDSKTESPIKHVIVIIGENRTFDHLFATYQPKSGQKVDNLFSKGIIDIHGAPGPNYNKAAQSTAVDETTYSISPGGKQPYVTHRLLGRPTRHSSRTQT